MIWIIIYGIVKNLHICLDNGCGSNVDEVGALCTVKIKESIHESSFFALVRLANIKRNHNFMAEMFHELKTFIWFYERWASGVSSEMWTLSSFQYIYKHRHKLDFEHENQVNFLLFNILIDIDCTEVYSDERQRESTTNTAEEKN